MKLADLTYILEAENLCCHHNLDKTVRFVSAGDMMSDILTSTYHHALLITGLVNIQVIRTAEMLDIVGIVFINGKRPTKDMIELAIKKDIPLMVTDKTLYVSCGLLYEAGLQQSSSGEYTMGL